MILDPDHGKDMIYVRCRCGAKNCTGEFFNILFGNIATLANPFLKARCLNKGPIQVDHVACAIY